MGRRDLRRGSPLFWWALGMAAGLFASSLIGRGTPPTPSVASGDLGAEATTAPTGPTADGTERPTDAATGSPSAAIPSPAGPSSGGPASAATASPDNGAAAPGGPPPASGPGPSSGSPGASTEPIRIGIGVPELGALANMGPNFDFGDVRDHFEAIHADWQERGLIPIEGREVVFHYRSYSIISAEEQRAACVGWASDDQVMAVIAMQYFFATECVPYEHRLPLFMDSGLHPERMERFAPYAVTLLADYGRISRNWVYWAHERGLIQGKRLGLYYGAGNIDGIDPGVRQALDELGYELVEEVTTSSSATGGPQDGVAAQRFAAARVEVAILAVSSLAQTNFMHSANGLNYRPTYLGADFFTVTADTAASTFPADQYDGTYAMTSYRFGEVSAGLGHTPEAQFCIDRYAAHSGRRIDPQQRPAEWFMLLAGCDVAAVVHEGLVNAGNAVDKDRLIAGIEQIESKPLGIVSDVTFGPGDHTGAELQRTLQWHADCTCWMAIGAFEPWFVP
ncbi:MAG: hypothetical protein KY469_13170 [Actinobacteria bacterium]|nr:hypothetical protein [Actinomycetota bacterium]